MRWSVAVALIGIGLHAQPPIPDPGPKFELASIKPSAPGETGPIIRPMPGGERYEARAVTLKLMIQTAFHIRADHVSGGPDWIDRDKFNLDAKAERPSSPDEFRTMLRNLLADRFRLKFTTEMRDGPVYVLTQNKSELKLLPHDPQNAGDSHITYAVISPLHVKFLGTAASIEQFAAYLGYFLDRPTIDRTDLKGGYDFTLAFTLEPPSSMRDGAVLHGGQVVDFSGPTIFEAVRQQIGLRLDARKAPVQTLTITRADRPTEN